MSLTALLDAAQERVLAELKYWENLKQIAAESSINIDNVNDKIYYLHNSINTADMPVILCNIAKLQNQLEKIQWRRRVYCNDSL